MFSSVTISSVDPGSLVTQEYASLLSRFDIPSTNTKVPASIIDVIMRLTPVVASVVLVVVL